MSIIGIALFLFAAMSAACADDARQTYSPLPTTPGHSPVIGEVVVVEGDNLWLISGRALSKTVSDPGDDEIHPYWKETIAINRATLRSGDPDLIYPGETVVLPAISESR